MFWIGCLLSFLFYTNWVLANQEAQYSQRVVPETLVENFSGEVMDTYGIGTDVKKKIKEVEITYLVPNFHMVDPGRYFRSGQLSKKTLKRKIELFGIRTIINLRGPNPGDRWYRNEKEVADQYGVKMIDIPMSANRIPHKEDLVKLLDAFRDSPRPILVHCQAGVDRTGEASAIYAMEYMGWSREEAMRMLSPRYFNFGFKKAKHYFIREVYQGEEWARWEYEPCEHRHYPMDRCVN